MEKLILYQDNMFRPINNKFFRFLYNKINWKERMIGIKGSRGVGKTTMILQYLKFELDNTRDALYVSADHPYFYTNTLYDLAEEFYMRGGKIIAIDEIHKYPNWSRELKNMYDGFPELKIIFTSSSILDIYSGEADLSRRAIIYLLPGLSYREFLYFHYNQSFDIIPLYEIMKNHENFARTISDEIRPLEKFNQFLKIGYYPFSKESDELTYLYRINSILNIILDYDLPGASQLTLSSVSKLKRLLGIIAESVPFYPNISSLASKTETGRETIYRFINELEKARILNLLTTSNKGVSALQKPDKIYLENTNLSYALKELPDIGSIRETFVLNQMINSGLKVNLPKKGDFLINEEFTIEVGGKNKNDLQIKNVENSYLVLDQSEVGWKNRIPLWLFGFLY